MRHDLNPTKDHLKPFDEPWVPYVNFCTALLLHTSLARRLPWQRWAAQQGLTLRETSPVYRTWRR